MSGGLSVSLAVGRSDLNQALLDGRVTVPGTDLTVLSYPSPERHWRMLRRGDFAAAEVSLGAFLAVHEREPGRFVAIPAFPHRRFRHSYVFVGAESTARRPEQLAGGRIGLRTWTNTAGVWTRGILQDEYGLDLGEIRWVLQDEDTAGESGLPSAYHIERVPRGETVVDLTARGELDALIYPEIPDVLGEGVRRLFDDSRAEEMAYVEKTGLFPIMHLVVLRADVVDAHPWLARDLLTAFRAAKDIALDTVRDPRMVCLAWARDSYEQQRRLMGADPWAYDAAASAAALETAIRYAVEQGIVGRAPAVGELFHPSTLDEPPRYVRA